MKSYPYIILTFLCLSLLLSGCKNQQSSQLVGMWSSSNVTLLLTIDGKFSIKQGNTVSTGDFDLLNSNRTLIFSYTLGNALRSMATSYTMSPDGQTLAIDRTCFGTQVLARVAPVSGNRRDSMGESAESIANRRKKQAEDLTWKPFSVIDAVNGQPGNVSGEDRKNNRAQASGESGSNAGDSGIEMHQNDLYYVKFVFPKPQHPDRITCPLPQEWPVMGLKTWSHITMGELTGT